MATTLIELRDRYECDRKALERLERMRREMLRITEKRWQQAYGNVHATTKRAMEQTRAEMCAFGRDKDTPTAQT